MDNGDSLLDVIDDTTDLFGSQNDNHGSLFNWADEFLGEETDLSSSTVAVESGNLATNVNQSNLLLTTQNYAVTTSVPTQNITLSTSQFLSKSPAAVGQQKSAVVAQTVVNPAQTAGVTTQIVQQGNQHFIVRTPSGNQIQINRQAQFQQQVVQPQQNIVTNSSFSQILAQQNPSPSQTPAVMSRSLTPNSGGLSFGGTAAAVSQTVTQMRSSPAPNVNLVHFPPNVQSQQQQPAPQQQQQFQIAPGTILQIPTAATAAGQNIVNPTILQQGQQALLGNTQQGTLVNAQNTVIQNPNVVNVNVAAPHVLCSNPAQQQRTNLGLSNIQTAAPSPFNIQGTLIQTAEGKSILIPSQNIAQPINIQGLSVATPIAQPQIQQSAQNTVSNMLHLTQPQQHTSLGVDNRTNQGLQQIVLNHQGQQILVQRAQPSSGQPQNIIVRTAGGQSGIVQLQQRAAQATPIQSAQQTLQALAAGNSNQLKIVNQQGTAGVPVLNIGGQNVTLQQLSNQLGNIQGLQLQQTQTQQQQHQLQQQTQQQQQQLQQQSQQQQQQLQQQSQQQQQLQLQTQQQDQLSFQNQNQKSQASSVGQLTFSQGQMNVQPQGQGHLISQQNVNSGQGHLGQTQVQVNTSVNSVENQTRLILQQIQDSLKKSQANAVSSVTATVSNIQAIQNKNSMNIKQEFQTSCSSSSVSNNQTNKSFMSPVAVKTEPNLIETLIKQENNPRSNFVSTPSSVRDLLTSNAQATHVTTTVSQASTQMSMFVLSNSQNVLSNTSTTSTASMGQPVTQSVPFGQSENSGTMPDMNNSAVTPTVQGTQPAGQQQGTATLQTIHLPPELQQQFQRVQLEIRKVHAATNMTPLQKQDKLQKLQLFQKRVLLKGRVLATTKAEPHQIKQGLVTLTQTESSTGFSASVNASPSISSSIAQIQSSLQSRSDLSSPQQQSSTSQFSPGQSNAGLKNLLKQEDNQVQPDSTSSLGQVSQSANSLSGLLGSPTSSTAAVNQLQMPSSNQSTSASQQLISANQRIAMPSQSVAPPPQTVASSQSSTVTTTAPSVPQVAVPTQIKIADKVLTLSLTPAQKEKVQSYLDRMTPEQQLQYLQNQQHVLQRIQKQQALNAQIRAQVEAQKKQAALSGQGQITASTLTGQGQITPLASSQQNTQSSEPAPLETTVLKPEVKTIPIPNTSINTQPTETPVLRAQKRSYMDIPKGTLINQQIRQDQNHATHPDTKRQFRSRGDACRRLLRYHVFQKYGPSGEEFTKFDNNMEDISEDLLKKKDRMFEKFRHLLFQETLRVQPSSELVMLQRMQNQDLRKTLEEERLQVKNEPESFRPMPMKFLCKEEADREVEAQEIVVKKEIDNSSDTNTSMEESIEQIKVEIKEEVVDLDDSSSEATAAKMRKLVIKTDGMNFRSCFKRMSMDSSRSSVDEKGELLDDSENNDFDNDQSMSELKHSNNLTSLDDDDDENTNEYSRDKFDSFDNETEQAALAISSAEESVDTDIDSRHDVFNVDNSLSRHPGQGGSEGFQNRRNFELASESMYYNSESDKSKDTKDFSNISRHSSVESSKTYIPKHTASVVNGSVLDNGNLDDSDTEDKFDMYQPITESLTDSEENSYYSADNAADQRSVMIDDDDDLHQGHWNKNDALNAPVDSDQESDQEVKAQMESAINSILSLSQGASNDPDAVYSYSQSNQFYNHDSQSDSLYSDSNELQAELDYQTDQSQSSMDVTPTPATGEGFNSDLDAAVNSILM